MSPIDLVNQTVQTVTALLQSSKASGVLADAWVVLRIILETALKIPALATNRDLLKAHVNDVIDRLLKGADTVQGTSDDLITPETAAKIRVYVNDSTIDSVVSLVTDALAGNLAGAAVNAAQLGVKCGMLCCAKPPTAQ